MITKGKISDFIWGFTIGDAIGVPHEFQKPSCNRKFEFKGFGTHNQKPGTWSDDTSLMLCQVDCIVEGLNIEVLKKNLIAWYIYKKFTANNSVFDIGHSTKRVIEDLIGNKEVNELEYSDFKGNGTLLRVLVLSLLSDLSKEKEIELIKITTTSKLNIQYCQCFLEFVRLLIKGFNKEGAFIESFKNIPTFTNITGRVIKDYRKVKSSGYILDTIDTVLYCFFTTNNYKEAIVKSIRLGGDTDSIAAILGGICGIYYNNSITENMKRNIVNRELIEENVKNLTNKLI